MNRFTTIMLIAAFAALASFASARNPFPWYATILDGSIVPCPDELRSRTIVPCPDGLRDSGDNSGCYIDNSGCFIVRDSITGTQSGFDVIINASGRYEWFGDWRHLSNVPEMHIRVLMHYWEAPPPTALFPEPDQIHIIGIISLAEHRTLVYMEAKAPQEQAP